jgi:hypothetical protein
MALIFALKASEDVPNICAVQRQLMDYRLQSVKIDTGLSR